MDAIVNIETINQYDLLFGLETLHPLVSVIDFAKATQAVDKIRMNLDILFLKDADCGAHRTSIVGG